MIDRSVLQTGARAALLLGATLLAACAAAPAPELPARFDEGAPPATLLRRIPLGSGVHTLHFVPRARQVWAAGAFGISVIGVDDDIVRHVTLGATTSALCTDAGGDTVYAVQPHARRILALEAASGAILWEARVADLPWQAAATPDGRRLYVTLHQPNGAAQIDTESRQARPLALPATGFAPGAIAVSPDGRQAVFSTLGGAYVLDTESGAWGSRFPGRAGAVAYTHGGDRVVLVDGGISAWDPATGAPIWTLTPPWNLDGLAVSGDGRTGYARLTDANGLVSVDLDTGRVCHRRTLPGLVRRLALADADQLLYLSTSADDVVVVDAAEFRCP